MPKLFTKVLISLGLLLLGSYGALYAHADQRMVQAVPGIRAGQAGVWNLGAAQHYLAFTLKSASFGAFKAKHTTEATRVEEKEEESKTYEKYLEGSHAFATLADGLTLGDSGDDRATNAPSGPHFRPFTFRRYLLFRTLRI